MQPSLGRCRNAVSRPSIMSRLLVTHLVDCKTSLSAAPLIYSRRREMRWPNPQPKQTSRKKGLPSKLSKGATVVDTLE
jgi:hypothetical protein